MIVAITASAESSRSFEMLEIMPPREDAALVVVVLQRRQALDEDGFWRAAEKGGHARAEATGEDLAASDSPAALADAVLPVGQIASRIAALVEQVDRGPEGDSSTAPSAADAREALATIAAILRSRTGRDSHVYESGTFLRRVQRRIRALLVEEGEDYIEALRASPDEARNLLNDLLIGVTEFFRDKREWEILEREVVPRLFEGKGPRDHVRAWVSGCSTGEEAYSIAILLAEHRARLEDLPPVQVFASDLDGRALAAARTGRRSPSPWAR